MKIIINLSFDSTNHKKMIYGVAEVSSIEDYVRIERLNSRHVAKIRPDRYVIKDNKILSELISEYGMEYSISWICNYCKKIVTPQQYVFSIVSKNSIYHEGCHDPIFDDLS